MKPLSKQFSYRREKEQLFPLIDSASFTPSPAPPASEVASQGSKEHAFLKKKSIFWVKTDVKLWWTLTAKRIMLIFYLKNDHSFHSDTMKNTWWFQNNHILQDF